MTDHAARPTGAVATQPRPVAPVGLPKLLYLIGRFGDHKKLPIVAIAAGDCAEALHIEVPTPEDVRRWAAEFGAALRGVSDSRSRTVAVVTFAGWVVHIVAVHPEGTTAP